MERATLLVLVLGTTALSGCAASVAPLATAHELQPRADDLARAWAQDAELVAITGIEGQYGGHEEVPNEATETSGQDPRMDGRLERWVYRFTSPSQDASLVLVMDENGTLLHNWTTGWGHGAPVGTYRVDSDEAILIAKQANEGFASGLEGDHRGVFLRLHRDDPDEHPTWTLIGGSVKETEDGKDWSAGLVRVDAVTGEVLFEMGRA